MHRHLSLQDRRTCLCTLYDFHSTVVYTTARLALDHCAAATPVSGVYQIGDDQARS
jgi:hypothetical protein